jgi:hypothetical protein
VSFEGFDSTPSPTPVPFDSHTLTIDVFPGPCDGRVEDGVACGQEGRERIDQGTGVVRVFGSLPLERWCGEIGAVLKGAFERE